ncbi:MAG: hypothetical protein VXX20_01160 [Verrucomicrobiota bacterium]|nr:hypothetical protein [Verrucomicrobiota bacterium]
MNPPKKSPKEEGNARENYNRKQKPLHSLIQAPPWARVKDRGMKKLLVVTFLALLMLGCNGMPGAQKPHFDDASDFPSDKP